MNKLKIIFRVISGVMLTAAIVFLAYVFTHPEAGSVFYIGNLAIGPEIWRVFYLVYAVVMIALFVTSFFIGKNKTVTKK